jgi:hypothetical protein
MAPVPFTKDFIENVGVSYVITTLSGMWILGNYSIGW